MRPVRFTVVTNRFAARGRYASRTDQHGPAGHHTGVDYGGVRVYGRLVRSSTPGRVVISEYDPSTFGHWVGVYNADDNVTITYWHMSTRLVRNGQFVRKGQALGKVGSTGNSTGPHLHVQANRGRGFDYNGHINPKRWVGRFR